MYTFLCVCVRVWILVSVPIGKGVYVMHLKLLNVCLQNVRFFSLTTQIRYICMVLIMFITVNSMHAV